MTGTTESHYFDRTLSVPEQGKGGRPADPTLILAIVSFLYATLVASHWDTGYIDFGDGNYMYLSWRMSEGAVLYKDLLAPQPPMHLLVGAALAKCAQAVGIPMLYAFRMFSLTIHLLTAWLVAVVARQCAWGFSAALRPWVGLGGGLLYLMLPIGFWWSLGYQSEHQEIVWLLLTFLLILKGGNLAMVGAGLTAGLAMLTNMTAAPYALFAVGYLLARRTHAAWFYIVPFTVLVGAVVTLMEWRTGAYLENVIFNQVGSFPRKELLPPGENVFSYAIRKIRTEGMDVLRLEGGFILLALFGLWLALRARPLPIPNAEFAAWWAILSLCSIVYVSKGGTMDYIFCLGEPYVAAFAAMAVVQVLPPVQGMRLSELLRDTTPLSRWVVFLGLGLVTLAAPIGFIRATLAQQSYELDAYSTEKVVEQIRRRVPKDGLVLSPPYYAFLAHRRIAEDYSEIFLWSLKYHNEKLDGIRGRGVETVERIARLLNEKKIAFVVLDLDQTGRIPEIREALDRNYVPVRQNELRTLNTRLMFYEPKR
jgi:hypothetical protein